jgi:hypothetical protein
MCLVISIIFFGLSFLAFDNSSNTQGVIYLVIGFAFILLMARNIKKMREYKKTQNK